jgi:hypothetical protein
MESGLLAEDTGCSPTSSWRVLETPVNGVRLGSGRRPSGEHGGGGYLIEGEIGPPPAATNIL